MAPENRGQWDLMTSPVEFQPELNIARPACADDRVSSSNVRRGGCHSEGPGDSQVIVEEDGRVRKLRTVEEVEELGTELHAHLLSDLESFDDGKIPIAYS